MSQQQPRPTTEQSGAQTGGQQMASQQPATRQQGGQIPTGQEMPTGTQGTSAQNAATQPSAQGMATQPTTQGTSMQPSPQGMATQSQSQGMAPQPSQEMATQGSSQMMQTETDQQGRLSPQKREALATVAQAIEVCTWCAEQCIQEANPDMVECIRLCEDVAELGETVLAMAPRNSRYSDEVVQAFRQAAQSCARECGRHPHAHCQECARVLDEATSASRKLGQITMTTG